MYSLQSNSVKTRVKPTVTTPNKGPIFQQLKNQLTKSILKVVQVCSTFIVITHEDQLSDLKTGLL